MSRLQIVVRQVVKTTYNHTQPAVVYGQYNQTLKTLMK